MDGIGLNILHVVYVVVYLWMYSIIHTSFRWLKLSLIYLYVQVNLFEKQTRKINFYD